MPLTRYGRDVWLPIILVALVLGGGFALLHWWIVVGVVIVLTLALLSFFRDPPRRVPANLAPGDMLSPADGVISAVLDVDSHEAVGGRPAKIIRIFLSVLNVHVNRSPCDIEVVSLHPRPGKYLNAQTEESASVNESNLIICTTDAGGVKGELMGIRQVSGMLARTIVCPLKPGARLRRGEKFGMIKFGSTTELILPRPPQVTVHVRTGDKVRGGLTLLATLNAPGAATQKAEQLAPLRRGVR